MKGEYENTTERIPSKMLRNIRFMRQWLDRMTFSCCDYETCGDCPMFTGQCEVNNKLLRMKKIIKGQ